MHLTGHLLKHSLRKVHSSFFPDQHQLYRFSYKKNVNWTRIYIDSTILAFTYVIIDYQAIRIFIGRRSLARCSRVFD